MLLPFFFIKVKRERPMIFFYIAITFILYTPFNANILGYDTLSIFILSLIFSVTALYLKTRKFYLICVLSLICALAILIRLPNVLAVFIIFFCLLVSEVLSKKEWGFQKIRKPATFVSLTFLFLLVGYSFYYDSWEQFIVATSNSNSHDLLLLFLNYLKDGLKLVGFVILILLGLFGYRKVLPEDLLLLKDSVLVLFFVGCLSFFVGYTKFSVNYALFLVALVSALVLVQTYYGRREKLSDNQLLLYLFLFFLFINPFGSNTGLLKAYSLLLLLPFVLSMSKIQDKKYWLILVAVLIPFSILTKIFGVYEDKNLLVLNEELKLEKLSPIRTNTGRAEFLKETDAIVQQLKIRQVEVFFYGDKSHIFHYIYPESFLNISSFFQPVDDLGFFKEIENALQGKDDIAVFIVNSYPENSPSSVSLLEEELINIGFQIVEDDLLKYYLRTSKNEN